MPHHSSSDCQVCTLVQNDSGLAPELITASLIYVPQFPVPLTLQDQTTTLYITSLSSRAPPLFS